MHVAPSLRRRPETKTEEYYITVSGGRLTKRIRDDCLHDCYESMCRRVDKRTVNVKVIGGFDRCMSFKRKRWTKQRCGGGGGYWQVRFLQSISDTYKVFETSCPRVCKCLSGWNQHRKEGEGEDFQVKADQEQMRTIRTQLVLLSFSIFSFVLFFSYRTCHEYVTNGQLHCLASS